MTEKLLTGTLNKNQTKDLSEECTWNRFKKNLICNVNLHTKLNMQCQSTFSISYVVRVKSHDKSVYLETQTRKSFIVANWSNPSSQIARGGRTGLVVRASDSGSGDPGSILGRVGVLFP